MKHLPWIRSLDFKASTLLRVKTLCLRMSSLVIPTHTIMLSLGIWGISLNMPLLSAIETYRVFISTIWGGVLAYHTCNK